MDIGKTKRKTTIEPVESPVPGRDLPAAPETDPVREMPDPVREPEKVPA